MNYSELKIKLKEGNCYKIRSGGNHDMYHSPITNRNFPVRRHNTKEVPIGTLKKILKDAGLGDGDIS